MVRFRHDLACVARATLVSLTLMPLATRPVAAQAVIGAIPVGANPSVLGANSSTNRIYVGDNDLPVTTTSRVWVIDGQTHRVVGSPILINAFTPRRLATNPTLNRIYVAGDDAVHVIDGQSATALTTIALPPIEVGGCLCDLAVDSANARVYAVVNQIHTDDQLHVIDGSNNTLISSVSLPVEADGSSGARNLAVNPATNRIYIAKDSRILVLDGSTVSPIASIPLNVHPSTMVVNAGTNRLYATNTELTGPRVVKVIDTSTNTVVTTVTLPAFCERPGARMAMATTMNIVAVTCSDDPLTGTQVVFIDGATNLIRSVLPMPTGVIGDLTFDAATDRLYYSDGGPSNSGFDGLVYAIDLHGAEVTGLTVPEGVAVNTRTRSVYVTNRGDSSVTVINGTTGAISATVPVGLNPSGVAANPQTNRIYVANQSSNTMSVIDGLTNSVLGSISVGSTPTAVAVDTVNNRIYVDSYEGGFVQVIDGGTNRVVATINSVGAPPAGIAVNPTIGRAYIADYGRNQVVMVDTATNRILRRIAVENLPVGVAVDTITSRVYVANSDSGSVFIIDGRTGDVLSKSIVKGIPYWIAVNESTHHVYVTNITLNLVTTLDRDGAIILPISVGTGPRGVAVNPNTRLLYTANADSNSASIRGARDDAGSTGFFSLSPEHTLVAAGDPLQYTVTWTVPDGRVWRNLRSVTLRMRDGENVPALAHWDEASNMITFCQTTGSDASPGESQCGGSAAPGGAQILDLPRAQLQLAASSVVGSGPTGRSVTITLSLSFKPGASHRTYLVEVAADDDFGNVDPFVPAGTLRVDD